MMLPGHRLNTDEQITAGGAALRYQGDGNAVLYAGPAGEAPWASGRFAVPGRLEMQGDGNLVSYDAGGVPYWATDTFAPDARLVFNRHWMRIIAPDGTVVWDPQFAGEPEPPPGVHPDPFVGQPRIVGGVFVDASGPRNPWGVHAGDLIGQGLILGVPHLRNVFSRIAPHGPMFARSWFQLHIPHGTWIPGPTEHGWNPLDDRLRFFECLDVGREFGIRWNLSGGGLAGVNNSTENELFDLVADAMDQIGPEHFFQIAALNEARDTGDEDDKDPVELIRLIDRVRHRHPHTLYATTAWTGIEDAATTARFTPRWAAHSIVNGYRGGHWWDKWRHVFSWMREGGAGRRLAGQDEPFGVERQGADGATVSAQANGRELERPGVMPGAGCVSLASRQYWTYMSGLGVVYAEPGFESLPGFTETGPVLRQLPRDLSAFTILSHGHPSRPERIYTVRPDAPDVRSDYAIAEDGRFVEWTYGPDNQNHDLPQHRSIADRQVVLEAPGLRVQTGKLG
jgi:hypothetical protein